MSNDNKNVNDGNLINLNVDINPFDAEAQKQAFEQTTQAVLTILSQEAKDYLANIYGDLDKYISEKIEASVNINKS